MPRGRKWWLFVTGSALVALLAAGNASASTYTNPTPISIGPDQGPANPYPATISVNGLPGRVTQVRATIHRVSHTYPHDLDIALVGPTNRPMVLMSEVCGDGDPGEEATGQTFTFAEGAPALADGTFCQGGTYTPRRLCCRPFPTFPPPAAPGVISSSLISLRGQPANGTWGLLVVDNDDDDAGVIAGGWSLDLLTRASCSKKRATLTGTAGDDELTGTPGRDVILGFGGNDRIRGLGGRDVICGGAGKDTLIGGRGKDKLLGEGGKDTLRGGKGKDELLGGKGKDKLNGGKSRDRLFGQGGKDKLKGGKGKDLCNGGEGRDRAQSCEKEKSI